MSFKSGFVSIIGKPNAGKSTLLNALLGSKLVIVTPKAQTTRHRIVGILNGNDHQIVFSDTPGIIKPHYGLHETMMWAVSQSLDDADLVILLIDLSDEQGEEDLIPIINKTKSPILLVLNKTDLVSPEKIEKKKKEIESYVKLAATQAISALKGENILELLTTVLSFLPEGPQWFEPNSLSDRPERFFIEEIIREKLFFNLEQEIPYGCEVAILNFKEEETIDRIQAEIFVEKQSHKGMVIGKQATMIRKIGTQAREDIEKFLGKKVFLELYVRVAENWKNDPVKLRRFGYRSK